MPNWCQNFLTVSLKSKGKMAKAELKRFKDRAYKKYKKDADEIPDNDHTDLSIDNFLPTPKALLADSRVFTKESELTKKQKALIKKHGAFNWYDWRCNKWGCKWDVEATLVEQFDTSLQYEFLSPWAPPIEAFVNISKEFPDLSFKLRFAEPGEDFAGECIVENGKTNSTELSVSDVTDDLSF